MAPETSTNPINTTNSVVHLLDPITDPRWDEFVKNHPLGWICHLSGWKTVLEKSFKHMEGYYYVLMDERGETIKAGLPVYFVNSWLTGKRLVSIPFTTLCDPLVETNDEMNILMNVIFKLSEDKNASFIEIRTFKSESIAYDMRLGVMDFFIHHYIELDQKPEELKKNFHRTCVRQRISRAEKSNLILKKGENNTDLLAFFKIYSLARKRLGLPVQPYNFFQLLWDTFQSTGLVEFLLAKKDNITIAGIILFKYKDRVSVEFACSNDEYFNLSPNHFIFWEAIKLAHVEGYKVFDFGRTSSNNKSLMEFKKHWGTTVLNMHHMYYPKEMSLKMEGIESSWKYKTMKKVCQKSPDSLQKIIGEFCYKHLG